MTKSPHHDATVLAGELWAILDEAPDGSTWEGEAEELRERMTAVLAADPFTEGTDPCLDGMGGGCRHAAIWHPRGEACAVPWCKCPRYRS